MKQNPFFYDVTLRDGNQALKKPWNTEEKKVIFNKLLALGVQGIEIGFPAASEMDFEASSQLAQMTPETVVASVLARCNKADIARAAEAVKHAKRPRIHTFIAMNPLGLEYVLKKDIKTVTQIAVDAVKYAKSLFPAHGQVQFSVEHFGDCRENLPEVIDAIKQVVAAGADIINLPNTVERFRPREFTDMVEQVQAAIGDKALISVHCHNDLGMATATTVESYFCGATQLETTLNGLGERAGNTNMYEVAVALHNSNVETNLHLDKFMEAAVLVSERSGIPIWEKAPVIGSDVLSHRSGIHQDGANKTKGLSKGQYIAFEPSLIGRREGEKIGFTSQSGRAALYSVYQQAGYPITQEEAGTLLPYAKKMAETNGELKPSHLDKLYRTHLCEIKGPFQYVSFDRISRGRYALSFIWDDKKYELIGSGHGPVESCVNAFCSLGVAVSVLKYEQKMMNASKKEASEAISTMLISDGEKQVIARGIDRSTTQSNIKAIFNGLNILHQRS